MIESGTVAFDPSASRTAVGGSAFILVEETAAIVGSGGDVVRSIVSREEGPVKSIGEVAVPEPEIKSDGDGGRAWLEV